MSKHLGEIKRIGMVAANLGVDKLGIDQDSNTLEFISFSRGGFLKSHDFYWTDEKGNNKHITEMHEKHIGTIINLINNKVYDGTYFAIHSSQWLPIFKIELLLRQMRVSKFKSIINDGCTCTSHKVVQEVRPQAVKYADRFKMPGADNSEKISELMFSQDLIFHSIISATEQIDKLRDLRRGLIQERQKIMNEINSLKAS